METYLMSGKTEVCHLYDTVALPKEGYLFVFHMMSSQVTGMKIQRDTKMRYCCISNIQYNCRESYMW